MFVQLVEETNNWILRNYKQKSQIVKVTFGRLDDAFVWSRIITDQFFILLFLLFLKFLSPWPVHEKNESVKYMEWKRIPLFLEWWVFLNDDYINHLQCGETNGTCTEHAVFFSAQLITFYTESPAGIMHIFSHDYSGTSI